MRFEELCQFIEHDMRMSHVYQPVMLRTLLVRKARASREDIARALLNEDRSQLEYYSEIARNMVGRVQELRRKMIDGQKSEVGRPPWGGTFGPVAWAPTFTLAKV
jgi:hypothetical protein